MREEEKREGKKKGGGGEAKGVREEKGRETVRKQGYQLCEVSQTSQPTYHTNWSP